MAGPGASRKRARENNNSIRTNGKKARLVHHCQVDYHSSSEEEDSIVETHEQPDVPSADEEEEDDILTLPADTGADSDDDDDEADSDGGAEVAGEEDEEDDDDDDAEDDDDEELPADDEFDEDLLVASDSDADSDSDGEPTTGKTPRKSKRNDPAAFALSMQKILSTKLTTSKRADPMLSRSSAAAAASKSAVDSALEAKAKKVMKEEKRAALEKGRVKDVLEPSVEGMPQVVLSASKSMEEERRLRKVAQKGVVRLFNAVRAAQVRASEAQRETRKEGMLGIAKREAKVQEMTKKGFLDLIASGGGGLKKGPIEEA